MIIMSSSISIAVMFLPISSTPPSGMMRITPGAGGGMAGPVLRFVVFWCAVPALGMGGLLDKCLLCAGLCCPCDGALLTGLCALGAVFGFGKTTLFFANSSRMPCSAG